MKNFTTLKDISNLSELIKEAILLKMNPFEYSEIGKHKTLVMLFFNSSLRTRLSTEKAAKNLGMDVMIINVNDAWNIEFEDGTVMNANSSEHIKEAAQVISQYADVIAVRAFPTLTDKAKDEGEIILNSFKKYATVPIINMESATAHPLQALADAITISELTEKKTPINHNQEDALKDADFVYVKNWSSYNDYGKVLSQDNNWMMTKAKLGNAKFMHCLPVRRNVVVEDAVLDSDQSVVIKQANNRTFAAQVVLKQILEDL